MNNAYKSNELFERNGEFITTIKNTGENQRKWEGKKMSAEMFMLDLLTSINYNALNYESQELPK